MTATVPTVAAFFDDATFSVTYLVSCPVTKRAAVIDPVLDFDIKARAPARNRRTGCWLPSPRLG